MKTLVLPVAGRSSRFPGMRPKWLLTMPDGKLMLEKAVEKLDMSAYERVVVVCLKEHIDKYLTDESLSNIISGIGHPNVDVCALEEPTASQSETVALALKKANIEGGFFVKDCDNVFQFNWSGGNEIAALDLNTTGLVDAKNKSYIAVDALGNIFNIVEKQVISNFFCCGGYGFRSSEMFLKHFDSIKSDQEVYISHVVYSMLMEDESFQMRLADSYIDWGTLREYRHFTRSFLTIFCDVDGVLLFNGSKFGKDGWATEPIAENLHSIARLQASGLLYLVITSSRPESEIPYLQERLAEFSVHPQRYVMGLPHSRRILVNDYSLSNPFPTALSVNLERDSRLLSSILDSISGS
jgi:NDP-sugar pyrophosphorylase family protein